MKVRRAYEILLESEFAFTKANGKIYTYDCGDIYYKGEKMEETLYDLFPLTQVMGDGIYLGDVEAAVEIWNRHIPIYTISKLTGDKDLSPITVHKGKCLSGRSWEKISSLLDFDWEEIDEKPVILSEHNLLIGRDGKILELFPLCPSDAQFLRDRYPKFSHLIKDEEPLDLLVVSKLVTDL